MIEITYDPEEGEPIADGLIELEFKFLLESIEIGNFLIQVYSTMALFDRIRLGIIKKEIAIEDIKFFFDGKEIEVNKLCSRRPWRTLVRIDDVDPEGKFFYVVVPGWDPQQVVRLRLQDLPENIRKLVVEGQITRLHAKVILGAEANEDLHFKDWESQ